MPTAPMVSYDESVTHQLGVLAGAVNRTPGRTRLYLLAGGMVLVIVATAAMQVRLNAWNQPFYDAIERRDLPEFVRQLWVFFEIAGILLVLNVAQTGANQLIRVRLRELATTDLIGNWMTRKRAARISRAGEIGVNPDQRIQADAQNLTEVSTDLGVGLLQSTVLLVSFIGVLWILSQGIVIPIGGRDVTIPGYMVWAALVYALSGSLVSWRLGRPLVRLGADRYAREADFRFALVQGSERAEGIALGNDEADSLRGLEASLGTLVARAAADRLRADAPDLGDRGLRLGGARLPDRGGGAGVFRGPAELRRADDGGRRLQPGAAVAALVRRQHQRDRRLAGDAAAGDELPPGAARARRRRGGRGPHRAERGPAGPLPARCGAGRDRARQHHPRPAAPRGRAGRARAHPRQAELGADELFPCDRRALERGVGEGQRAAGRRGRLPDAAALPAVGDVAGGAHRGRRRARGRGAARRPRAGRASTTSRAPSTPPPAGTASSGSGSRSGFPMRGCCSSGRSG